MNSRITIYKSIISPNFWYCPTILYFGTKNNINKLQLLQNKCLRTMLKCNRYTPIRTMLECLHFLDVNEYLYLQTMSFIYKLYHRELPDYLNFTIVNEIHEHYTRNNDRIYIPKVNKENTKNSLYFGGLEEFNSLPCDIKNTTSLRLFKIKLRKHMIKN